MGTESHRARAGGEGGWTACAHGAQAESWRGEGTPCTAACAPSAWHAQPEGENPPRQADKQADEQADEQADDGPRAPMACRPIPEEGGDPSVRQRALPVHGMPEREGGIPRSQEEEEEEGAYLKQCALPTHGMHGRGSPHTLTNNQKRTPRAACAPSAQRAGREGGEWGRTPAGRGGGATPRAGVHALCVRSEPGDVGKPPRPAKDPPQRRTKRRGGKRS